jgi:hypothetical protein
MKQNTHSFSKETIWHFVCDSCKLWWSIASSDDWNPKQLYCPHCGIKNAIESKEVVL